jgi:hypothetical protein
MWVNEYVRRVQAELDKGKKSPTGKNKCDVYVYDLLEESGLDKPSFYGLLFNINKCMDDNMVLYLKGANN